jgi:hypothetical protein
MPVLIYAFFVWAALAGASWAQEPATSLAAADVTQPAEETKPTPEGEFPDAQTATTNQIQIKDEVKWVLNAGATVNLTEGNSSTRLFGATFNGSREGRISFFTFLGNGQYGVTRIPEKLPYPRGDTPQARAGTPGKWAFDENINNWLGQFKFGRFFSTVRTNYLFAQERAEGNRFAGFWQRYETQVGYGRKFQFGESAQLNLEIGPLFSEEHQVVNAIRSRFGAAVGFLATIRLSEHSSIVEDLSHLRNFASNNVDFKQWADYRTRSTTSLVLQITRAFHLQTGFTVSHTSIPPPGAHPLDLAMTNALLYSMQ